MHCNEKARNRQLISQPTKNELYNWSSIWMWSCWIHVDESCKKMRRHLAQIDQDDRKAEDKLKVGTHSVKKLLKNKQEKPTTEI